MRILSSIVLATMVVCSVPTVHMAKALNAQSIKPSEQNLQTADFSELHPLDEHVRTKSDFRPLKENINISYGPKKGPKGLGSFFQKILKKKPANNLSLARSITQSPADLVQDGFDWLLSYQNLTGYWTKDGENMSRDTSAVLDLFDWLDYTDNDTWNLAVDSMVLYRGENNDSLARTISVLGAGGNEFATELAAELAKKINSDHGFGYDSDYQSDTLTTALAVKALTESEYVEDSSEPTIYLALYNLLTTQNADGGYGYAAAGDSTIYPTEIVLDALLPYDGAILAFTTSSGEEVEIDITAIIDAGIAYLKSLQNADGGFGESVVESAFAFDLILRRNDHPFANQSLIEYLNTAQADDGSFNDSDPYATALAVKALAKPDLSLGEITADMASPEVDTVVSIPITNEGYLTSSPFNLEIYYEGEFLTDFDIGATMETTAVLNMDVSFTGGFPAGAHDLEFRVIPAEDIEDLSGDNNTSSATLNFSDYDGPLPPEWAGAATSSTAGNIAVTWLSGQDSDTAGYIIYIGSSPGTYTYASSTYSTSTTGLRFSGFTVNATYYFSVVSVDASGNRGDYSMESSAVARSVPSQNASMYGYVESNGERLSGTILTLYSFGDESTADSNGEYSINIYPGNYYFTATQGGYDDFGRGVTLPESVGTEVNFELQETDDGIVPLEVSGLTATADDGEITLTWDAQSDSDFDHFNLYRSTTEITDLSRVSVLDTITDSTATSYIDDGILNGINYYYALTIVDSFGNESSSFTSVGPVLGNSEPILSNLTVFMDEDGFVKITYDLSDEENTSFEILLEYFDGVDWQVALATSGAGDQTSGLSKSISWLAKSDLPDQELSNAKVRVTANDLQLVNYLTRLESSEFELDTLAPSVPTLNTISSPTNATSITISGTKEADSSVLLDGEEIVPLDSSTTWSYDLTLRDGANSFLLSSVDAYSNESGETFGSVTLDTTAPTVTVNSVRDNATPYILTGTVSEIGSTVRVTVNSITRNATVTGTTWRLRVTTALAEGFYNVVARATDAPGNVGTDSTTNELEIDTTAPPAITGVTFAPATSRILIRWTASSATDVGRYRVYRSTSAFTSTASATLVGTVASTATQYRDTSVTIGQNYHYAVVAYDTLSNVSTTVTSYGPIKTRR